LVLVMRAWGVFHCKNWAAMSGSLLLWIVLAIATFWLVGLYNRLMRMRKQGLQALESVEKHLRQYAGVVNAHLGVDHGALKPIDDVRLPVPTREWEPLLNSLDALEVALKKSRMEPLAAVSVNQLGLAVEAVQAAWARLCEAPMDLAGPAVPDAMRMQWDTVSAGVRSVRTGFNQVLTQYNEAIHQFPARIVVGVMRFETAGLL